MGNPVHAIKMQQSEICPAKFSLPLKENTVTELNSNIFVECKLTLHRHTDVLMWKNKEIYLQVQGILVYTNTSCSCILGSIMKNKWYLTVIWVLWDLLYRIILDNSSGFSCPWKKISIWWQKQDNQTPEDHW